MDSFKNHCGEIKFLKMDPDRNPVFWGYYMIAEDTKLPFRISYNVPEGRWKLMYYEINGDYQTKICPAPSSLPAPHSNLPPDMIWYLGTQVSTGTQIPELIRGYRDKFLVENS